MIMIMIGIRMMIMIYHDDHDDRILSRFHLLKTISTKQFPAAPLMISAEQEPKQRWPNFSSNSRVPSTRKKHHTT